MKKHIQRLLTPLALLGGTQLVFAPVSPGDLSVTILPPEAVTAGAQWQVDGGSPQYSGATTTVPTGSHTVSFTTISGWITPDSELVNVTLGQTTATNGTYIQIPALTIAPTGTNSVMISWPSPSTGFNLEQSADLTTSNWLATPALTNDDGTNLSVIVNQSASNLYFRLKK